MAVDDNEVDPTTQRVHSTPRSRIAELVENLRAEGWQIELEEGEHGQLVILPEDVSATEEWPAPPSVRGD